MFFTHSCLFRYHRLLHLHPKFLLSSKADSDRTGLISVVTFKPIRLGQENSCGLHYKNTHTHEKKKGKREKKSPEATWADLQDSANK